VQTTDHGQTEQHYLGPAHSAHGLAFQWIDDRYKAFHGEGHHKPDGAEAGQITEEGEELAEVVPIVDIQVEKVQPLDKESDQKACITHGQCGQVKTGG